MCPNECGDQKGVMWDGNQAPTVVKSCQNWPKWRKNQARQDLKEKLQLGVSVLADTLMP